MPARAVLLAVLYATETAVADACDSVTVNRTLVALVAEAVTATSPAASVGNTTGGGGGGGVGVERTIVPVAVLVVSVAFVGLESRNVNVWLEGASGLVRMETETTFVVSPGRR